MSSIIDTDYKEWIRHIASHYRQSQIRAAVRVNSEVLRYYWQVGCEIHNRQFENRYGSRFYANASRDLRLELGINEGLSESSLRYSVRFYELYAPLFPNRQQVVDRFPNQILQQPAEELKSNENNQNTILQQPVENFKNLIHRKKKRIFPQNNGKEKRHTTRQHHFAQYLYLRNHPEPNPNNSRTANHYGCRPC